MTAETVPVRDLQPGTVVVYGGDDFRVVDVLPLSMLSGHVVVGQPVDPQWAQARLALLYANDDAEAVLSPHAALVSALLES